MWARPVQSREQLVLFENRLDQAIPPDHAVRLLDQILANLSWKKWEECYHQRAGQPPIHPRVLAGVLVYGLLTRIRSSRALEEALRVRLDFMWLVEGRTIDHTTISEFRRKHPDELKDLFVQVCLLARRLGMLTLDRLAFDGTRVRANNRRSGTRTPQQLREEKAELAKKFVEFSRQAEADDARDEEAFGLQSPSKLPDELKDAQRRDSQIQAALTELDRWEAAGEEPPNRIPLTDPDSRVMPNKHGGFAANFTPTA